MPIPPSPSCLPDLIDSPISAEEVDLPTRQLPCKDKMSRAAHLFNNNNNNNNNEKTEAGTQRPDSVKILVSVEEQGQDYDDEDDDDDC